MDDVLREVSFVVVEDDMNENEEFDEVERDLNLRLTELKEYLQSVEDAGSSTSSTAAKQYLKGVDHQAPFHLDNMLTNSLMP
jgi:hypothetical protein